VDERDGVVAQDDAPGQIGDGPGQAARDSALVRQRARERRVRIRLSRRRIPRGG
jgi:hypothetical protein